jgi:peptidoglycan-N-acetylglucosamine deacetylase
MQLLATVSLALVAMGCGASGHDARRSSNARVGTRGPLTSQTSPDRRSGVTGAAVDRFLAYTSYIRVGTRRRKDIALTFDDGPSPYTAQILSILERTRVPATFFEIGRQAQTSPGLIQRESHDGFDVGDHTLSHPALAALSASRQQSEIGQGARRIASAGAAAPRLFRPPYGSFNASTLAALGFRRMLMVLWSVDTKDYRFPGVRRIVYTALSGARAGAIILMHDGGGPRDQTVEALPRIIRGLQRRGFHLVTVTQLVADDPPPPNQGPATSLPGRG